MERTRVRLVEFVEWLVAAACVAAGLMIVAALAGDVHRVTPVVPVIAGAATAPAVPANVLPGSISVPELVLPDGKLLKVGTAAATLDGLGPQALAGPMAIDRTDAGERESRAYRYSGMEFFVVTANDTIIAIYR